MDTKAQADHVAGNASYRFLDGAFSDHAAAAATLSTMITYCEARPGLCDDEPIKLLLVGTDTNSSRAFFAGAIPANTFGPGQHSARAGTVSANIVETVSANIVDVVGAQVPRV